MKTTGLKRVLPGDLTTAGRDILDAKTMAVAAGILTAVRDGGMDSLRTYAEKFGEIEPGAPLFLGREDLRAAWLAMVPGDREALERMVWRVRRFAEAQMSTISQLETTVPGGLAGHRADPVASAGCYAPGGRFPLPSSVIMTVVTARTAGVRTVWAASPKPAPATLAAAFVSGADGFLCAGGAQAIGAFAYGAGPIEPVDVIAGPGNRFVTAAKKLVAGACGIDMLAGPSELVVLADGDARPDWIAADLLGQAEHDPDARAILVTDSTALADRVDAELTRQCITLPTRETAQAAIGCSFAVIVGDMKEGCAVCDRLAPEHLEIMTSAPDALLADIHNYGAVFVGGDSAEVFGDYGAGPNHVLPTGRTSRYSGGLSVMTFLRLRTWLKLDQPAGLIDDCARLARIEGLEAHARAAEIRGSGRNGTGQND